MRNKAIFTLILLFICGSYISAQNTFIYDKNAKKFYAKITVEKCESNTCSGKASIKIFRKKRKKIFQEFSSDNLVFMLDKNNKPSKLMTMYEQQSPLVFGDFNFDGKEDIAIRNGNKSSYGEPSFDVYIFNSKKKQFIINKELTDLASTNLGMFCIDTLKKRLVAYQKTGSAYHVKSEFEVVQKKKLLKVYELEEDATKDDDFVYITEKKRIKTKWDINTQKFKITEYYSRR